MQQDQQLSERMLFPAARVPVKHYETLLKGCYQIRFIDFTIPELMPFLSDVYC